MYDTWNDIDLTTYENLSASDCVQRYTATQNTIRHSYLLEGGTVVAVSSDTELRHDAVFAYGDSYFNEIWPPNYTTTLKNFRIPSSIWTLHANTSHSGLGWTWVCEDEVLLNQSSSGTDWLFAREVDCDVTSLGTADNEWTLGGHPVAYCLADRPAPQCTVQFLVGLLVTVTVCNALKAATMVYICCRPRQRSFITIGDCMASFLGSYSRDILDDGDSSETYPLNNFSAASDFPTRDDAGGDAAVWQSKRFRWGRSVRWQNWLLVIAL